MGWIPRQIHYIWLGVDKKYIPATTLRTISQFHSFNPDWTINIWSDHPMKIEKTATENNFIFPWEFRHVDYLFSKKIKNYHLLAAVYAREKNGPLANHAAASDILRLMILFLEGGIYSDLDVACLCKVPDLFACGNILLPPLVESGDITNALMAACPGCYILQEALDEIGPLYFGKNEYSIASWSEKRELPKSKSTTFAPRRTLTITMTGPGLLERRLSTPARTTPLTSNDDYYQLDPAFELPLHLFKISYAKTWLRVGLQKSRHLSYLHS